MRRCATEARSVRSSSRPIARSRTCSALRRLAATSSWSPCRSSGRCGATSLIYSRRRRGSVLRSWIARSRQGICQPRRRVVSRCASIAGPTLRPCCAGIGASWSRRQLQLPIRRQRRRPRGGHVGRANVDDVPRVGGARMRTAGCTRQWEAHHRRDTEAGVSRDPQPYKHVRKDARTDCHILRLGEDVSRGSTRRHGGPQTWCGRPCRAQMFDSIAKFRIE